MLDDHGQPPQLFNEKRRVVRDLSEMLGIAKGMIADGIVSEQEANYLRAWGRAHHDMMHCWPNNILFKRLERYFQDGRIDEAERLELHELLTALVGGTLDIVLSDEPLDSATALPIDDPAPLLAYGPDEIYVFTGRFAYGTRRDCETEVHQRGSVCEDNVTRRTTFLVIGTFGSRDWLHSSFGQKILKAVDLRRDGFPIRIVGEDHWASRLSWSA